MRTRIATAVVVALLSPLAYAAPAAAEPVARPALEAEPVQRPLNPPSGDIAITGDGDAEGFHLLVADAANPGHWQEIASLSEPGFSTDRWIGQYCLTGSGDRAAVVYAPREFANSEYGMYAGAFAAVVDLATGAVVKLDETTSLAHYNPGCGLGESVVFSALGSAEGQQVVATRLQIVDTRTKKPAIKAIIVDGQLSSPVPVGRKFVAAKGRELVEIDADGDVTALSRHPAVPFRITPEPGGAIAFQTVEGEQSTVKRLTRNSVVELARAEIGTLRIQGGDGGKVLVVGTSAVEALASAGGVPSSWRAVNASASLEVSHGGGMAVLESRAVRGAEATTTDPGALSTMDATSADPELRRVKVTAMNLASAETVASLAAPAASTGALSDAATMAAPEGGGMSINVDPATVTWDPDRTCAAPRNDPTLMVYQPTPEQVTWAANLAVQGQLTMTRGAGWNNLPLPSYSPQGQFPSIALDGGGRVPAQILLGILAQESNMWQASDHTADGYSGNVHQGGFYGRLAWDSDPDNDWDIHWDRSDCGYGVAQVTTGMRADETSLTDLQQTIVMTDYASNIAAGLRILQSKWNQTRGAGLIANGGEPGFVENWWFAIWAYNTGFYPQADAGSNNGAWGLGWLNNPANEILLPDRGMFLRTYDVPDSWGDGAYDYGNSKHPNAWSYPERVIGWAATPLQRFDFVDGGYPNAYEAAGWGYTPEDVQPGHYEFCTGVNQCDQNGNWDDNLCDGTDGDSCLKDDPSPCARADLHCWWHGAAVWVDEGCAGRCGTEVLEWDSSDTRPVAPNLGDFEPDCYLDADMPWNARIIDDVGAHNLGPDGCADTGWTRAGNLSFQFDGTGTTPATYPSKIDFHQIGGGFGGHFWFANTWREYQATSKNLRVTGTWTLNTAQRINGWGQVMVHLPGRHALTQQANYKIHGVAGGDRERFVNTAQRDNGWVQLGTYRFDPNAVQSVSLSNVTADGRGDDDIAWDAVAFVPLSAKPKHFVVAMGDSYISGEGVGDYYTESNRQYGSVEWNACRRSKGSWPRRLVMPGWSYSIGANADVFNANLDFQNVSCSGAVAEDVYRNDDTAPPSYWTDSSVAFDDDYLADAEGQFREMNQADSGALSADTTLVLLSIGGNDAGFPTALSECGDPFRDDCATPSRRAAFEQDIVDTQTEITKAVSDVQNAAPNARIVVLGYPALFTEDVDESCFTGTPLFTTGERVMFNALADFMAMKTDTTIDALNSSQGWDVAYASTWNDFQGHGACSESPWINQAVFVNDTPNGDGDIHNPHPSACALPLLCISRGSFHPNASGATAQAGILRNRLIDIGYS